MAFLVESGASLTSGTAPARRAALMYPDGIVGTLTADGLAYFDRMVEWLLSTGPRAVTGSTAILATVAAGPHVKRARPTGVAQALATTAATTRRRALIGPSPALALATVREARPRLVTGAVAVLATVTATVKQARPVTGAATALATVAGATAKRARPTGTAQALATVEARTVKRARPVGSALLLATAEQRGILTQIVRPRRAAPTNWPPLAVRVETGRGGDGHVTRELRDLRFRSVVPGGFASATMPLARPLTYDPEALPPFSRVVVSDTRSAAIVWEGRLEDPGRSSDDNGQVWELTAIGPSAHATDRTQQLVYVDTTLDRWERRGSSTRMATNQTVDYGGPTGTDDPAIQLQFPSGTPLVSTSALILRYSVIRQAGQRLSLVTYRHREGKGGATEVVLRVKLGTRTDDGDVTPFTVDQAFDTAERTVLARDGVEFDVTKNVADIRLAYDPGNSPTESTRTVGDDLTWTEIAGLTVMAQRFRRDRSIETTYPMPGPLASEVVMDLLHRMLPQYDVADALVEPTSFRISQLAYPDGVTAAQVLADLLAFEGLWYWAAWERLPSGRHAFEFRRWPTRVRYEADLRDCAYSGPASSGEVYNSVQVRWRNAWGHPRLTVRTAVVPALDAAGITRQAFLDLGDAAGSAENAARAGDEFLAEHANPPNAGTLVVPGPIVDLEDGGYAQPWEIRPGHLLRLRGASPRVDSLNASDRDGISVFRVVAVDYEQGSNTATLELDSHPVDAARTLAETRKALALARRT